MLRTKSPVANLINAVQLYNCNLHARVKLGKLIVTATPVL